MRFIFLVTIGLFVTLPLAAQAESGFGTGFTEQSAKAFDDPAVIEQDEDMAATAEKMQEIAPAAGEEQNVEPASDETNAVQTDSAGNGIILHGEVVNDGTFIELTD